MKALVVGEDNGTATRIRQALRLRWPDLTLTVAADVDRARPALANGTPDVVVVTTTGSGSDAVGLVQDIRSTSDIVLFVVGPASSEAHVVEALEAGADDYIAATASESLLVARVCAALRRAKRERLDEGETLECGDLQIDPESHEVRMKGRLLYLTPTEFKLLYHLAQHQGRVVTQEALETVVWGSSDRLYIDVLRKHIRRLRQKLESRRGAHTALTTVPRVGYKLVQNSSASSRR